jgi:hypothetical protein
MLQKWNLMYLPSTLLVGLPGLKHKFAKRPEDFLFCCILPRDVLAFSPNLVSRFKCCAINSSWVNGPFPYRSAQNKALHIVSG